MSAPFRIFLASSSELAAERAMLEIRVNRINKRWNPDGIFLHLEIWEDFVDTVSRTRKQDDYNAALRRCGLFAILVHHRLGKYSAEEFEAAWRAFIDSGRPRILVYLKDPPAPGAPDPGEHYDSVRAFRRRLGEIDHFPTPYSTVAELLDHFGRQLDKLRDEGFIGSAADQHPSNPPSGPGPALRGSGAQAVGDRAQAAANRGVNIGGSNKGEVRTGDTYVDTGGGAYFGGPVRVNNGNVVGRDHHETHSHARDTAAERAASVADILHPLRQAIERHAGVADRPLANEIVDELAAESSRPASERSDDRIARLAGGLADLLPVDGKAHTASLLGALLAGRAGPLTRAVLEQLRGGVRR